MMKEKESPFIPWQSDQGNGKYKNPVLFADYSDPDVIRVDDVFYMTASSFNCTPGLPVLKSFDLVNWSLIGHALENLPYERYSRCCPGCGVWAPAIRFHQEKFSIVFPMPDEGLFAVETDDPEKGWSEPWLIQEGKGLIDPCPFWDDNGKTYIIHGYAMSRAGIKSTLHLMEVSSDLKAVIDPGKHLIDAMGRIPTLEGPKMHKRGGYYYIQAPAGGVAAGYQMFFRSKEIKGPYEEKIVLSQRGSLTNGPHQGALLDDKDGKWWFIHFQEYQPWGRIVHLQPAKWENDWPVIGADQDENEIGRPVSQYTKPAGDSVISVPADSDDFTSMKLGLQWQWNANHRDEWFELTGDSLILKGDALNDFFSLYPRILTQKLNAPNFRALVNISFNPEKPEQEAGICIAGQKSFRLGMKLNTKGELILVFSDDEHEVQTMSINCKEQILGVEMNEGGLCRFLYMSSGEMMYFGPSFHAVEGRWIGARFGLYCIDPSASECSAEFFGVKINEEYQV